MPKHRPSVTVRRFAKAGVLAASIAGIGLAASSASGSSTASPVQLGGKDRCDPLGPVSLKFYDARTSKLLDGASGVSYERSSDGHPQRTVYLESAGYVVSVCLPSGAVREERYQQLADREDPQVVSIYDVRADGKATGVTISYAEATSAKPASAPPPEKRISPHPLDDPKPTIVAPEVQALKSWNLRPGHPGRVPKRAPKVKRHAPSPSSQPTGPIVMSAAPNKCYHNAWVYIGYRRTSRSLVYHSAFDPSYYWIVHSGARAFPDVWNYCGWTVGSGLDAIFGGYVSTFILDPNDGVNQIGFDHSNVYTLCGTPAPRPGCAYHGNVVWTGSEWSLGGVDIAINPYVPWANGAVPGYFDLQGVIAHEFGHAWGLGDIYGDPYAYGHVMFGDYMLDNSEEMRYLAYGDYQAMRTIYP